jgi:hypothetical protein
MAADLGRCSKSAAYLGYTCRLANIAVTRRSVAHAPTARTVLVVNFPAASGRHCRRVR